MKFPQNIKITEIPDIPQITEIQGLKAKYLLKQKEKEKITLECKSNILKNFNKDQDFISMISSRYPQREAERYLNRFILKEGLLAVVLGAASIYLLRKLLEQRYMNGGMILVIEAEQKLAEVLQNYSILPEKETLIIHPENMHLLYDIIETIDIENILGYRIFKNPTSIKLDELFYQETEYKLKKHLSSRFSDLFTKLSFEPKWILNSFSQISHFTRSYPVNTLFNKGRGVKSLLISTGPSLRKSLPYIKELQNKFFIACVDSAYRVLHRYGIRPHLIITLDSQAYTLRHFSGLPQGTKEEYPILYADLVANPQVIRSWQGPLFFGLTAQYIAHTRTTTIGSDFIEDQIIKEYSPSLKKGIGDIQSGGSVATSLFDLLRQMNFDQIILVGQDLAYTYREIHCTGTHHTDTWLSKSTHRLESLENINQKIIKKRNVIYTRSIKGSNILADYVLSLYKQWFQDTAEKTKKLLNATEEGLPIPGIAQIKLDKLKILKTNDQNENKDLSILSNASYWLKNINPILHTSDHAKLLTKLSKSISPDNKFFSKEILRAYPFLKSIGRWHDIQIKRLELKEAKNIEILKKRHKTEKKAKEEAFGEKFGKTIMINIKHGA